MQNKHDSILRAVNNPSPSLNILTFPTHEAYQSNLSSMPHTFYMLFKEGIKPWSRKFREIPSNHILLRDESQLKHLTFDLVLSQNKFGQYQIARPLADGLNLPLISIEHTLPYTGWSEKRIKLMHQMRGNVDVFISKYSIKQWLYDENDPAVKVIHHGIDTELFHPTLDGHNDAKILTVVSDWINRNWCMPTGQKILTTNGYIPIEKICIGDMVLTDSGAYHPVTKTFKRQYFGPMVSIYTKRSHTPLMFTSNHDIRVFRNGQEKYVNASRIQVGDMLKFPKHRQTDFSCDDEELSWLIGTIVGDGSISDTGRIEICMNPEEDDRIARATKALKKYIGTNTVTIRNSASQKMITVEASSKIFAAWLKERIGGKSHHKAIPDFIFNGSEKLRIAALIGLWECDGSFKNGNTRPHKRSCYSTVSIKLAGQVSAILHSLGIGCLINKAKRTTNKSNGNTVWIYRVVSYGANCDRIQNLIHRREVLDSGYSYLVSKIELDDEWNGTVYNCEVAVDHSYVVYPGLVAHNCCNFMLYKELCLDQNMPVNPIGDTPGFSTQAPSTSALISEYQNASVFFNTSTISPVPTALLEAMACGCPVVTTATCMIPDIVEDGVNGFISNDKEYLSEKLRWCLENRDEALEMGKRARETIEQKFSLSKHLESWQNLFMQVYGKGRDFEFQEGNA